jgi:hypothetical protein
MAAQAVRVRAPAGGLADITFSENGDVEVGQVNTLYRLVGWDRSSRRTAAETAENQPACCAKRGRPAAEPGRQISMLDSTYLGQNLEEGRVGLVQVLARK